MISTCVAAALAGLVLTADLRIHDVQGTAHVSPFVGQDVVGVEGIVTALSSAGFFMQDPADDGDPRTSEGVRVATGAKVAVGDRVIVGGGVREARPGCAACSVSDDAYANLAVTEIAAQSVVVAAHGSPLPPPVVVGGARQPPRPIVAATSLFDVEEGGRALDPDHHAIDFYESLEGMRVELDDAVAVGPTVARAGGLEELAVVAPQPSAPLTAQGALRVGADASRGERMFLANDLGAWLPLVSVGDRLSGSSVGVLDYAMGKFVVLLTGVGPFAVRPASRTHLALAAASPGELAVATFNLENLSPQSSASKVNRLAQIIAGDLGAPDLLALQEVQDASGRSDDGTVSAEVVYAMLIDAIVAAGGPRYEAVDIAPIDREDGGEPGGNIRVAALYRSDRGLALVQRAGAGAGTANAVVGTPPALQFSPGRVAPDAPAFAGSRKPLAVEWAFRGAPLFSIIVHFDSQRADPPPFGRFQPAPQPSRVQRLEQARAVGAFVESLLQRDHEARAIVLGDFNDAEASPALAALEEIGLCDLARDVDESERYTEIFDGGAQMLDHILVTPALQAMTAGVAVAHVDADFPDSASDHDPVLARFAWDAEPRAVGCTWSPRAGTPSRRWLFWVALFACYRRRRAGPAQTRKMLPKRPPSADRAAVTATPRKSMAHTPSAAATVRPSPSS